MSTHKVTDQSFEAEVLNSDTPVVVDFWAEWCGPCKMIGPSLEELAKEYGSRVKIAKINIDENPHSPSKFGVRSIPTLMVFKGGKVASTKVGAAPKGQLQSWIDSAI
jgi:thioredoxin 1